MKQKPIQISRNLPVAGFALAGAMAICTPAQSLEFEFDDFLLNVDTTLGAAVQWRTESQDKNLLADDNSNDGNNNFDTGLVSARGNVILEVGGEYKDLSFFVRADAVYDYIYDNNDTDMSDLGFLTYNNGIPAGGNLQQGELPNDTINEHGKRTRLLDAFATYNFDLGGKSGAVRVGRQVISWGESTFYQGVNALQNPIDAVAAQSPGTEAREIFLPTAAIDLKWDLNNNFGTEIYYKLGWEKSTLPGVGSYFSSSDITGPGAERVLLGPLGAGERIGSVNADDSGQWGIAGRYMTDEGSNFELYYTNSHSNIPGVEIVIDELDFGDLSNSVSWIREVYTEDIEEWAASFSSTLGEAQVYLDGAYSDNMPFVDVSSIPPPSGGGFLQRSGVIRGEYWQVSAGFTDIYTAFPWLAEQIIFLAEANYQGNDLGGGRLVPPPDGISPGGAGSSLKVTETAWGYQFRAMLQYFSVISGLDVTVPITFKHDVDGYGNAIALNNGLKEDQKNASIGVDAFYLTNWQFSAKYSWFFGNDNPEDLVISDRDNFALSMKYIF